MKIGNIIKVQRASLSLLQQGDSLNQNAIHMKSRVARNTLASHGLIEPEDFIELLCSDKIVTEGESAKLSNAATAEQTFESYMLTLFKLVTGWKVDWHRNSTIWSVRPTMSNSLFLQRLKSNVLSLVKVNLIAKLRLLKLRDPVRKASGVIAILSGAAELQWHIMSLADEGKRAKKLYELYRSSCKAIKKVVGKSLKNFFPKEALLVTGFIRDALLLYPNGFVFSEKVLKGIKVQSDPG